MNNKQKLNKAFSDISDPLVESAVKAPRNNHPIRIKLMAAIASLSIFICFVIGIFQLIKVINNGNDSANNSDWVVIYSDRTSTQKNKAGLCNLQYSLCINYAPMQALHQGVLNIDPKQDICAEMFGQWLISAASMDYSQHFDLFEEEFLNNSVYAEFQRIGLDTDAANQKIAQVVADTVGFTYCRVEYSVLDVVNSPELLEAYKSEWAERFEEVGLDVENIEEVCEYLVDDIKAYWNDIFCINAELPKFTFYKYNGNWYVSPNMLDDDISIDLVQSEKGETQGYYKLNKTAGIVDRIENGYIVLYDTEYYLIKDESTDIAVGDYVVISYYSVGATVTRVSDGTRCNLGVIASVEKTDEIIEDQSEINFN